jgi:small-conductance mechanosensitive channel
MGTATAVTRRLLALVLGLAFAFADLPAQDRPPDAAVTAADERDRARQERLRRALAQVPGMGEITVAVVGDVVTLGGRTDSLASRAQAVEIAGKLGDVLHVVDGIEVAAAPAPATGDGPNAKDEQLQRRLTAILAQVGALEEVEVKVHAGVVTLRGETTSEALREQAGELAREQDGAVFVVNDIALTRDISERLSPSLDKVLARFRDWLAGLPLVVVAVLIVLLFWGLSSMVGRLGPVFRRLTGNRMLQDLLRQTARILVVLVGVFLALEVLDATALVGGVLGTAGVVGLAIGFAFRDIAENYLASIILSVRRPFRGNDLVKIGEHHGTVIRLSASDTVLMAPDGNHLHLPNAMVFKSAIVNFTRNSLRRFEFVAGVSAEADLQRAQALGVEILAQLAGVVGDPAPFARIEALGDSNVAVRFFGWVDQTKADFGKVSSEAIRIVKTALEAHGIELPVPIHRVQLERLPHDGRGEPQPSLEHHKAEAQRVDVTIRDDLGEQVERDRRTSADKDLLTS